MKKVLATLMSVAVVATFTPVGSEAQTSCPAEVTKAKELLAAKGSVAKAPDVQAPRSLAGARTDVQAPRGQDVQAPRGQDVQAPRGQDVQSPRTAAAPKGSTKAASLIKEAEAACKAGDMNSAKAKAEAAIAELK